MIFQYEAMDACGREVKDEIEADSTKDAQVAIQQAGLFATKISKKHGQKINMPKTEDEIEKDNILRLGIYLGIAVTIAVEVLVAFLWLLFR
jgi:type II secretory pathway component PulF